VKFSESQVELQPQATREIELVFIPTQAMAYEFVVDANVRGGNSMSFKVEGYGSVPSISEILLQVCLAASPRHQIRSPDWTSPEAEIKGNYRELYVGPTLQTHNNYAALCFSEDFLCGSKSG
jgi:hypothetical protein